MDPRLLQYYGRELQYIRELGGEFAREYPKIAGRLGLETFECAVTWDRLPGLVDRAIRKQLPVIRRHAARMPTPEPDRAGASFTSASIGVKS